MAKKSEAEKQLDEIEAVFAALAHPARRHILLVVNFCGGSMTAGEIADRFACSWPTTSRHLAVLEKAGLITHEKTGRTRAYRVAADKLDVARKWLAWFDQR